MKKKIFSFDPGHILLLLTVGGNAQLGTLRGSEMHGCRLFTGFDIISLLY